jgi:hypothetical protein
MQFSSDGQFAIFDSRMQNEKLQGVSVKRLAFGSAFDSFYELRTVPALYKLLRFDRQDLPSLIITAGGARRVGSDAAPALRAFVQLRRVPAIGRFACAQPHLGRFTFWNSHGRPARKHISEKKQMAGGDFDMAYALGANGFFTKTIGFVGLVETVREKTRLWNEAVIAA